MSEVFPFLRDTDRFRIAMGLEYKGTAYRGWQVQKSGVATLQQTLEHAIAKVANEPVATIVAGRTDAGVHATNQVVHFDTKSARDDYGWMMGINGHLPEDISVQWVQQVDEGFHARFSCTERSYRFVIHNQWVKSALFHDIATWERYELDVESMQSAANRLLGTHDFSSFRAAECQAHSPVRTVHELKWARFGSLVVLQTRADGYLHHMVRNLVGVLLPIGRGRKPVTWVDEVLAHRDRTKAGVTADGSGLYFARASYEGFSLPIRKAGPDFLQPLLDSIDTGFDEL